jgi:hypothetical protein
MAKIKVSQSTIDQIKKMGMDKALKSASNASPEMKEGLRRMYGEKRLAAAGASTKAAAKSTAPGAISGKMKTSATSSKSKSSAPSAISGKKVSTTSKKATPSKKSNTTSNPATAAFNKLSPYGDKTQKFKSPMGEGLATKKSVKGKPSIGEQISGVFTGKTKIGPKPTAESVAATMAKRMGISVAEYNRRFAAAEAKYKANKK